MKSTRLTSLLAVGLILSVAAVGCRKRPVAVENIPNQPLAHVPDVDTMPPLNPEFPMNNGNDGSGSQEVTSTDVGIPLGPGHTGWGKDPSALASQVVHFGFDTSTLKSSEKSKVAAVAEFLKSNPATAVEIEGHCDERGTEEYNRSLGERRALTVREELVHLGIEPNRVDTVSFGEDRPANPDHNEAAWRENRRGEFILLTPPQ
jgi:peptidoglycan-associated lipoprotein